MSIDHDYDVIVIGGGPGGASTAGLLARSGYDVLVLEKEKFPRYHIGESFVPGMNPVIDELGARDAVEAAGFTQKRGISLLWGAQRELWTVDFDEGGPYDYTWQVKRADFDLILLEHARKMGATVIEEATVRDVVLTEGRATGVTYSLGRGAPATEVSARYVVDASGQTKLLGRRFGTVEVHDDLKNLAVWSYYQGGTHFEGDDAGNILIENHLDGWLWLIPLSDGTRSVGFVGPNDEVAASTLPKAELLESKIASSRMAKPMLEGATRVADVRAAKDWSYTCTSFAGPGYVMVGDCASFIDPLFSTGVTLAMRAASSAAATVAWILEEPHREQEYQRGYEEGYRSFLDDVRSFVRFFYDASKDVEHYWAKAKSIVDPIGRMTDRQDFVLMVSGLNAARAVIRPGAVPATGVIGSRRALLDDIESDSAFERVAS